MTYKQAINKKKSLKSDIFIEKEMTFTVFVTPSSHEDLKRYLEEIRGFYGHLTDADAKRFSSNGVFAVHGLWTDGANVIYKEIC